MATEWMPLTRFQQRSWLLANGEIVTEPRLEQTSTGRKIRVAGTKKSFFAGNLDTLLWDAVEQIAAEKNTRVVMEVVDSNVRNTMETAALNINPAQTGKAKAHMVHDPGSAGATTNAWWRFKHPSMPIEAVLMVRVMNYPTHTSPGRQMFSTTLAFPTTDKNTSGPTVVGEEDPSYTNFLDTLSDYDLTYKWREFLRDNRPNWSDAELVNADYLPTAHKAVERTLNLVRAFEELDTLQIPDVTDLDNPGWLDLELYETNVNAEFISDLTEWMDSNPAVDGVLNAYRNLMEQMAQSGFRVGEKVEDEFMAALLSGDKPRMNMTVHNVIDPHTYGLDRDHTVSIHLPSGTIIVECAHKAADRGEIAEKWEETLMMAKLTGQEDVLLEFARKAALDKAQKGSKGVIKDRQ